MAGMRSMIEQYAGIPSSEIKGTRAPFLLMGTISQNVYVYLSEYY